MKSRKDLFISMLGIIAVLSGCYEFESVEQPDIVEPNSSFEIPITLNCYPEEADSAYGNFGILLPNGWSVKDSIPYNGVLIDTFVLAHFDTTETRMELPVEENYSWWWFRSLSPVDTLPEGIISFRPIVTTNDSTGFFLIDYLITINGDIEVFAVWSNDHPVSLGLPLSITVTNTQNDGPGSLRQALSGLGPRGEINFNLLYPATIQLSSSLRINRSITLSGPENDTLIIAGNRSGSVIIIDEHLTVNINNIKITHGEAGYGGGINTQGSNLFLRNVEISDNFAYREGGAIYSNGSSLILQNVYLANNKANWRGGAIFCIGAVEPQIKIENSLITQNNSAKGAAIYSEYGNLNLLHCSIISNESHTYNQYLAGPAIVVRTAINPVLLNSILWNDAPGEIEFYSYSEDSTQAFSIEYCNILGGEESVQVRNAYSDFEWSPTNMQSDPLFQNSNTGDYHLNDFSPCIGSGSLVDSLLFDMDGGPRANPPGSNPDIGAYEHVEQMPISAPHLQPTPEILNYGQCFLGIPSTLGLTLANRGSEIVLIDSINIDQPSYIVEWDPISIISGAQRSIPVVFTPSTEQDFPATITIFSNDPENPNIDIQLQGSGFSAPAIQISPASLSVEVPSGGSTTMAFRIENMGDSDLNYEIFSGSEVPYANRSLHFDGIDDRVEISSTPMLSVTDSFTIECWFNFEIGENQLQPRLLSKGPDGAGYELVFSDISSTRQLALRIGPGNFYWDSDFQADVDYHVACTYSGAQLCLYLNGDLEVTYATSGEMQPSSNQLYIGQKRDGGICKFRGHIDEVRIWNLVRSAAQIDTFTHQQLDGNEEGLVGYWPLQEGHGTISNDISGHEHIAQLLNGVTWSSTFIRLAPAWLNISPIMGSVAAQDDQLIQIMLDGSELPNEAYPVGIDIVSNDPNFPLMNLPLIFQVGLVSVDEVNNPTEWSLNQNYPNPFNPSTTISYSLPEAVSVELVIYDIRGGMVKSIQSDYQPAGNYHTLWTGIDDSGNQVSTGVYFARLQAGDYTKTIKMVYLR